MKHLILFFFLIIVSVFCYAQNNETPAVNTICETPEERAAYLSALATLKQAYYASNPDAAKLQRTMAGHVMFAWPMKVSSEYDFQYNYFNLQNFVDQNRGSTSVEDYKCGDRTYDGHDAADINLYPFWWRLMDNNYVMAVAAAPGIILSKNDGNYDRNCSKTGSANSITILHDDGTTTRYLHLKKNSLTSKINNERVEEGEFLGFTGSSGRSSNPHLHFAVYDENDDLIEPFFEAANPQCNVQNTDSWWKNQRAYWEPQINRLMTHSTVPSIQFCPDDELVNAKNQFNSSEIVTTGIAFMDGQDNDAASCSLIQPNGNIYSTWITTLSSTSSRQYKTHATLLPTGNTGTWVFKVVYRNRTYVHFFTVGCSSNLTITGNISGNDGHIAGNTITATAIHTGGSNSKVLYQAGSEITLKPGFEAREGIHFKARIKDCGYTE